MNTNISEMSAIKPLRAILFLTRWLIIAGVLVSAQFVNFTRAVVEREALIYSVIGIAVLTVVFQLMAARWKQLRSPLLALMADIVLVTVVIYFSDGVQSPYYALYYITVISAAVTFGVQGALLTALMAAVLSLGVEAIQSTRLVTTPLLLQDVVETVPYLFLIATISGVLSDRLRVLDEATARLRAQRAAQEREMEIARKVQRAQLPTRIPDVDGVDIAVVYKPAREVGGDLYDFYKIDENSIGVTIADVAGKGVPAALLVSSAKYAVRAHFDGDPGDIMHAVNHDLSIVTGEDSFVTMLHGTLDLVNREFHYANAGHMPPMVVKASGGETVCHKHSDPPLGVLDSTTYSSLCFGMEPGDTLVLYTDGITDALVRGGSGITELEAILSELHSKPLETWENEILRRIDNPFHRDDVTVVALRIK